jgi:hypothetical protein
MLGDEWNVIFDWPTSPLARKALLLWLAEQLSEAVQLASLKCEAEGCPLTPTQEALLLSAGAMMLRMEGMPPLPPGTRRER